MAEAIRERVARTLADDGSDGALDKYWERWQDEWRNVASKALRSLRLAEDEGAVRAVADAFENGAAKFAPGSGRLVVDFKALLAALDRYLSGEQEQSK